VKQPETSWVPAEQLRLIAAAVRPKRRAAPISSASDWDERLQVAELFSGHKSPNPASSLLEINSMRNILARGATDDRHRCSTNRPPEAMSTSKQGIDALLKPDNWSAADRHSRSFAGLRSHDTQSVITTVVDWPRVPRFQVRLVHDGRRGAGGYLLDQLQAVSPN